MDSTPFIYDSKKAEELALLLEEAFIRAYTKAEEDDFLHGDSGPETGLLRIKRGRR